jgi:hypothetical protein
VRGREFVDVSVDIEGLLEILPFQMEPAEQFVEPKVLAVANGFTDGGDRCRTSFGLPAERAHPPLNKADLRGIRRQPREVFPRRAGIVHRGGTELGEFKCEEGRVLARDPSLPVDVRCAVQEAIFHERGRDHPVRLLRTGSKRNSLVPRLHRRLFLSGPVVRRPEHRLKRDIGWEEREPRFDHRDGLFIALERHGRTVHTVEIRVVLRIAAEEVAIHFCCALMFACLFQTLRKTKLCLHVRRLRT